MNNPQTPKHAELREQFSLIFKGKRCRDYSKQIAHNNTRLHRALSWLKRSEDCNPKNDAVEQFLFLWISFNAMYGDDNMSKSGDKNKLAEFLRKIVEQDEKQNLAGIMLARKDTALSLIDNQFLYKEYWESSNSQNAHNIYGRVFADAKGMGEYLDQKRLTPKQTEEVLCVIFKRLYMLRIQIVHGVATHGSSYNGSSLEPGNIMLNACVPAILKIMLEAMNKPGGKDKDVWGRIANPPFLDNPDKINKQPPKRGAS